MSAPLIMARAQTSFNNKAELKTTLCQNWCCESNNQAFHFLDDMTFWFTADGRQFFGRWDFDPQTQTILIDFSEDNIIDENFKIVTLTGNKFICKVRLRVGGPISTLILQPDN